MPQQQVWWISIQSQTPKDLTLIILAIPPIPDVLTDFLTLWLSMNTEKVPILLFDQIGFQILPRLW